MTHRHRRKSQNDLQKLHQTPFPVIDNDQKERIASINTRPGCRGYPFCPYGVK